MKRTLFGLVTVVLALGLIFAGCINPIDDSQNFGSSVARATAVSGIKWYGDSDKAVAANITETASARNNASGTKITSNAHSADFPGIYFIWDSKQKDNGYLKVDAAVFDKYDSFVLTSKESNTYWDFPIEVQPGQVKTADNCYVFFIPKVYNNKNINMVFIGEWVEKSGPSINFEVTVYHRVAGSGEYLVYPGVGETFASTDENYIEWLNDVNGFTFLNLYLAAIRSNDPADMARVAGYVCIDVLKDDPDDFSFTLVRSGNGADIKALITPVADGHYYLTFWYGPEEIVISYDRYRAYVKLWNDLDLEHGRYSAIGQTLFPAGLAHYNALLTYYSAASLPPYYYFDLGMKGVYDYWADLLEPGLLNVCGQLGIDLAEFVKEFNLTL